jgi:hypothetical protein
MKDAIYDVINGQTGIECIYNWQDGPIPDKPFFGFTLTAFRKIGRDVFIGPDGSGNYQMQGNRDFTLLIQGFGPGIVEKTFLLQTILERPDIHETFRAGGLFPYDIDQPVQDVSGLDQSEPEERSSWDLFMRTDSIISDVPAGLIEKVNIDATYKQAGKPDIDSTINIDSTT